MSSTTQLMEKLKSADPDFRYMGLNDLMATLSGKGDSYAHSGDVEKKLVPLVLELMHDTNGEVQNMAVKTLSALAKLVNESVFVEMLKKLTDDLTHSADSKRDISSVGLKAITADVAVSSPRVKTLISNLVPKMLLLKDQPYDVLMEMLDILLDMVTRFGSAIGAADKALESQILETWLGLLKHSRVTIRKRAVSGIGAGVACIDDASIQALLEKVLKEMKSCKDLTCEKTLLMVIAQMCLSAGNRTPTLAASVAPVLLKHCKSEDDEVKEVTLQAAATMFQQCTAEAEYYACQFSTICAELVLYDPNNAYDEDEDDVDQMDEDQGEDDMEEDEDEADGYSDDDDMSWKVRRNAAKLARTLLESYNSLLPTLTTILLPVLIRSLNEREQTVRIDNIAALTAIVSQAEIYGLILPQAPATPPTAAKTRAKKKRKPSTEVIEMDISPSSLIINYLSAIYTALFRSTKKYNKSLDCRQAMFVLLIKLVHLFKHNSRVETVLSDFVTILHNSLEHDSAVLKTNSSVKIDGLEFLRAVLCHSSTDQLNKHLASIMNVLSLSIQDKFYKVVSEGLITGCELTEHIRTVNITSQSSDLGMVRPEVKAEFKAFYDAVFAQAGSSSVDSEIKENAIECLSKLVFYAADELATEQLLHEQVFPLFSSRLTNEITRLSVVKNLITIARSPLNVDLSRIVPDVIGELTSFLRQNQRTLRVASLDLAGTLLEIYGQAIADTVIYGLVKECLQFITDADLQLLPLSLVAVTNAIKVSAGKREFAAALAVDIMPALLKLMKSRLLGTVKVMNALKSLFAAIASVQDASVLVTELVQVVSNNTTVNEDKYAVFAVSQCIAAVVSPMGQGDAQAKVVKEFGSNIPKTSDKVSTSMTYLSLHVIGELSIQNVNVLEYITKIGEQLIQVLAAGTALGEDIKSAIAFALGNVANGNVSVLLPQIVAEFKKSKISSKPRYLFLVALDHLIGQYVSDTAAGDEFFDKSSADLWELLFTDAAQEGSIEGTRNVVAECIGKLVLLKPAAFIPELVHRLSSPSASVRVLVLGAVKYTFADQTESLQTSVQALEELLQPVLSQFLSLIADDSDLVVKHMALSTLNTALHKKPLLIAGECLMSTLPMVFEETSVRQDLIHSVDMGPFKHKVDDGLDIRKGAFECLYTLMGASSLSSQYDLAQVYALVVRGMLDPAAEIQVLSYLMLIKMCAKPQTLQINVQKNETEVVNAFKAVIFLKQKENAVKLELDKHQDLVRSAIRALMYVLKAVLKATQLEVLLAECKKAQALSEHISSAEKELAL